MIDRDPNYNDLARRAFLTSAGAAALYAGGCKEPAKLPPTPKPPATASLCAHISEHAWSRLRQAVEYIAPRGAEFPGALDAGADKYIARELNRPENASLARFIGDSLEKLGTNGPALPMDATGGDERRLVSELKRLTLEGMFTHPRHGGNQGGQVFLALNRQGFAKCRS